MSWVRASNAELLEAVDQNATAAVKLERINTELVKALQECTNALTAEIERRYGGTQIIYLNELIKYERDMAPVYKARAIIAKVKHDAG